MAAAFRPVNTSNTDYYHKDTSSIMHSSPATPRPNTAPHSQNDRPKDDGRTPTRVTFSASNDMRHQQNEQPHSDNAHSSSTTSPNRDSMDVDMEDSDNEAGAGDDNGGSDGESVNGDGTKSKKKKSQRFYCTDFPPCNLSFTRSEHLARHIRSNAGAFSTSNHHTVASPAGQAPGWSGRRDSTSSNSADDGWRRRTWHPDSRVLNGQQPPLNAQSTVHPNPPPPMATPATTQFNLRLPGIESFDPLPQRPPTPPRRTHSPMVAEHDMYQRRMPNAQLDSIPTDDRRNLNMYDASLQRGINRLDIGHRTPPSDSAGSWASEANKAVQAQAERVHGHVRFEEPPRERYGPPPSRSLHQHTMSAPSLATSREAKRHGWYSGPVALQRDAPLAQDSRAAQVDKMVHPNFTGFSGFPTREQQQPQQQQEHPANSRFDALVAVATNESSTAAAY
ncbi:C2H2 finger domain transcription factor dvrA [Beauveria bassiana]|nr:C2H2 finger domain transcription factor dvrA [Beauveria bassiana]